MSSFTSQCARARDRGAGPRIFLLQAGTRGWAGQAGMRHRAAATAGTASRWQGRKRAAGQAATACKHAASACGPSAALAQSVWKAHAIQNTHDQKLCDHMQLPAHPSALYCEPWHGHMNLFSACSHTEAKGMAATKLACTRSTYWGPSAADSKLAAAHTAIAAAQRATGQVHSAAWRRLAAAAAHARQQHRAGWRLASLRLCQAGCAKPTGIAQAHAGQQQAPSNKAHLVPGHDAAQVGAHRVEAVLLNGALVVHNQVGGVALQHRGTTARAAARSAGREAAAARMQDGGSMPRPGAAGT